MLDPAEFAPLWPCLVADEPVAFENLLAAEGIRSVVTKCLRRVAANRQANLDATRSRFSEAALDTAMAALEYAREHYGQQEATQMFWDVFCLIRVLPAEARQAALTLIETLTELSKDTLKPSTPSTE